MAGQPLQYFQMWSLVQQNYNSDLCNNPSFMQVVSQELLMAIFWEETQFANIRQLGFDHNAWLKRWLVSPPTHDGQHAVGFGQVERETLGTLQTLDPDKLDGLIPGKLAKDLDVKTIDLEILKNDGMAVQITWRALQHLYSTVAQTKFGLVKAYGGGNPKKPNVPLDWLICEAAQVAYQHLGPLNYAGNNMQQNMRLLAGAFWIAKDNGNFPRAFGVTQQDAAKVGKPLRDIVTKYNMGPQPDPKLIADLRQFVVTV
jgi:hypothetical protein